MVVLAVSLRCWKLVTAVAALLGARRYAIGGGGGSKGSASAAVSALELSAKKLHKAGGRRLTLGTYSEGVELLMPAFTAYGRIFDSAARKDVLGNVAKLRRRSRELGKKDCFDMVLAEAARDPAKVTAPDSAARALFWVNRILHQIALSFENLLDERRWSFTKCATDAYTRTCAPYNLPAHRTMARIMLNIIPDRAAFVKLYGFETMDDLAPHLAAWIKASQPTRAGIDAFFAKHPHLAPARRY